MFTPLNQSTLSNNEICEPISLPSQDPVVKTWHHDCSNTSRFEYTEIPIDHHWTDYDWTYTEVELESDGQSFTMPHMTNTSPVEYLYGPIYTYTLPDAFPIAGLRNFSVHMELDNSNPYYCGVVHVGLLDELNAPILLATIDDLDDMDPMGGCRWNYYIRNRSIHTDTLNNILANYYKIGSSQYWMDFANMTWSSWFNSELWLEGSIPVHAMMPASSGALVPPKEVETAREIKYLVIMFGMFYKAQYQPLPPFRVHDIYLEYELGGVIDTSPPFLPPQLDMVYVSGQLGNAIIWKCSDEYPYRYWLLDYEYSYSPSDSNRCEGFWNGGSIIQPVDGLPIGNRTFLLILQDKAGFIVWDRVTVTVLQNLAIQAIATFFIQNQLLLSLAFVSIVCIFTTYRVLFRSQDHANQSPPLSTPPYE